MDLFKKEPPAAQALYTGSEKFDMVAGAVLKIETTPGGADILAAEVPAGKAWEVRVSVHIIETNE